MIFDILYKQKDSIEKDFGGPLVWERLDDKQASRIKAEIKANIYNEEEWPEAIEFMTNSMVKLRAAFDKRIKDLNSML